MYIRFVRVRVKPGMGPAYDRFYRSEVAPAVLENEGCLLAHLVQDEEESCDFVSLTFWRSPEDAARYQDGGQYAELVERHDPFLDDSAEWRMVLKEDLTLSYEPVKAEPEAESFDVAAAAGEDTPDEEGLSHMYVRIVAARAAPGKLEELKALYQDNVIPGLMATDGCRYAYLVAGHDEEEVMSVTLWETRAHAAAYEASGRFQELLSSVRPALSSLYQWKTTLDPNRRSRTTTSEDVVVRGFRNPGDRKD